MDLSSTAPVDPAVGARIYREFRRLLDRASRVAAEQGPSGIPAGTLRWLQRMVPRTFGSRHLAWRLLLLRLGRENAFAVGFLDMDQLTQVDLLQGRAAADRLLRAMVASVNRVRSPRDRLFRYGGDEYVCVFPGIGADIATDRLEQALSDFGAQTGARFSFGVVGGTRADTPFTLMKRAESVLFARRRRERAGKRS